MNNKILIAIIVVVLVGVGGSYFLSSRNTSSTGPGHMIEDTSGKPVAQSHQSYEIEVTSQPSNIEQKKPATFRYKIKNDKGEILKTYEVAHEKIMHFITVRKDLAYFQHLHPEFNESTGEFTVVVTFPDDGPYRLFPDFTPGEENPQKLPVTVFQDVDVGYIGKYKAQPIIADSVAEKMYGDYQITFLLPKSEDRKKQMPFKFSLLIKKNGQEVTNLENYLGALGHSVILKEEKLDFIHTHALSGGAGEGSMQQEHTMQKEKNTGTRGPQIDFETTFPEPGVYKIFVQFQDEGKVQTVDYTVKIDKTSY